MENAVRCREFKWLIPARPRGLHLFTGRKFGPLIAPQHHECYSLTPSSFYFAADVV